VFWKLEFYQHELIICEEFIFWIIEFEIDVILVIVSIVESIKYSIEDKEDIEYE